jgi:hypothetical protein
MRDILMAGAFRQVTLDDPRLAPEVGVIAPQLFITTQGRKGSGKYQEAQRTDRED